MNKTHLILASASPRRRELLSQAGLLFDVVTADCDENVQEGLSPEETVRELSFRKAEAVINKLQPDLLRDCIILGADTLVCLPESPSSETSPAGKELILGKPADEEEAFRYLSMLQGNIHSVVTGVTLLQIRKGEETARKTFHERSDVFVFPMSGEEIREYIRTGEPMDKAGAYGIQGSFAKYIEGIKGSYTNIVGLPLGRTWQELKKLL